MNRILPIIFTLALLSSCGSPQPNAEYWDWFSENSDEFLEVFGSALQAKKENDEALLQKNDDAFNDIVAMLKTVNPGFSPQIGASIKSGKRDLIVTVFGDTELFDEVDAFINSAPIIEGWNFVALKPAQNASLSSTIRTGSLEIELKEARFVATPVSKKYDVTVFLHDGVDEKIQGASGFARTITIDFLGERLAGNILGNVKIEGLEKAPERAQPFLEIKDWLEKRI